MERISIGLLLIIKYNIFLLGKLARLVIGRAKRDLPPKSCRSRFSYIYVYIRTYVSKMRARVSDLR